MLILPFLYKRILVFWALIFLFLFSASETLAGNIYLGPGQTAPSQTCTIPSGDPGSCDPTPDICWNSQSVGVTDCGAVCDGGDPWTKYNLLGCRQTTRNTCNNYYQFQEAVYSTADKCSNGQDPPSPPEPYLRKGQCDGSIDRSIRGIYKTCCTNTTPSFLTLDSCVPTRPFSGAPFPPYDGVCPAGSKWIMCNVDQATCNRINAQYGSGRCTTGPCGQSACGPTTTTPTSTCSDGIQNGNETGIDCGGSCPNACPAATPPPGTTPGPTGPPDLPVILVVNNTRTGQTIGHVDATRTNSTSINAQTGDILRLIMQAKNRLSGQEA